MKFKAEYSEPKSIQAFAEALKNLTEKNKTHWKIMEVCGGQTHSIMKYGIDQLLPKSVELVHGPGCPVCVTPIEYIDKAIEIAKKPNVIFTSFGDMLRVRGTHTDLLSTKAQGADVRIVYSVLDSLEIAKKNPDSEVVFFAVGFETTAPLNAAAVVQAHKSNVKNFSLLVSHVMVPPAIEAILSSPTNQVQGFLAAGHVCTIMGFEEYEPLVKKYKVPMVVTGFEPLDIIQGIYMLIELLEQGRAEVENQYTRCVTKQGNRQAQNFIQEVFKVIPRAWRGIGEIPSSGLGIKEKYKIYDAENKFGDVSIAQQTDSTCQIGLVLRGELKPSACPSFGKACTPENPLGATMVSSEGACAAYYRYRGLQEASV